MDVIFWNSEPLDRKITSRYIGPYKIAHWVRKHGYTAQVVDFITRMTEDELYEATKKFITKDTVVLGVSTTFLCNGKTFEWPDGSLAFFPKTVTDVAARIKKEYPKIKLILGGYASDLLYMSGLPDATISSYTSSVEDIFLEYVEHQKKNTPLPLGRLHDKFYGLIGTKVKLRMLYDTARNPNYKIEFDDFKWHENDAILDGEPLPLDISRGCIFACRFCQYPHLGKGKFDYVRGMEYIKQELIENYNKYKTVDYLVLDDTFNDTELKLSAFHEMTSSLPFKIRYTAYLRADLIHRFPDTAHLLKDSGLVGAVHGIESFHPYASKIVGKAWGGKHAKDFIPELYHNIWNKQVAQQINIIVGLPKETPEDILETANWAKENDLYYLHCNGLGLEHPDKANRLYTITSEFERNSEKYGFKFDSDGNWYNETWSKAESIEFNADLAERLFGMGLAKTPAWDINSMLSYGLSMDYLISTAYDKIAWGMLQQVAESKFREYYEKLMNLPT